MYIALYGFSVLKIEHEQEESPLQYPHQLLPRSAENSAKLLHGVMNLQSCQQPNDSFFVRWYKVHNMLWLMQRTEAF